MENKKFLFFLLLLLLVMGGISLYWLWSFSPSSVEDNPSILRSVDLQRGEYKITYQIETGRFTHQAQLARVPPLSSQEIQCSISYLEEKFHNLFSAYLNEDKKFELIVWDQDLEQERSFNEILVPFLKNKCQR